MGRKRFVAVLAIVAAGFGVSNAGATDDTERYKMSPVDNGFVRLDTQTGEMAFCTRNAGAWSCQPMPEGGAAKGDESARLRNENAQLREENRRMEETFGLDAQGSKAAPGNKGSNDGDLENRSDARPEIALPDEEQVDQAVDYLERMIRKFRERFEAFGEKTKPRGNRGGDRPDDPDASTPL